VGEWGRENRGGFKIAHHKHTSTHGGTVSGERAVGEKEERILDWFNVNGRGLMGRGEDRGNVVRGKP